jgi:hypothetical protein
LILNGERELGLDLAVTYLASLPLGVHLAQRADARVAAPTGANAVLVVDPRPGADADPTGRALPASTCARTS